MSLFKYIIFLVFFFLSGCWDRTEMNDIAFVTATALDLADNGNIMCYLQIAAPATSKGAVSGGGSSTNPNSYVIFAEGKTGNEVHQKLQKKSSHSLFYSHRSVVFISERLARHGTENLLDIFTHDPRNRLKAYIMVVKDGDGKNERKMESLLKEIPSEVAKELQLSGDDVAVTLRDFFISSDSEGVQPVVGLIEPEIDSNHAQRQIYRVAGAGVFKGYKLSGLLDVDEALAFMWVTDKLKYGRITANVPQSSGEVGMMLIHTKGKIITQTAKDSVQFKIKLEGQGSLVENTSSLDITDPDNMKRIKKALEDAAKKQVQDFLSKIQKKYQVDSVGFGQEVYKNSPDQWEALKDQWDTHFPEAEISIEVHLALNGAGMVHSSFYE
ncbi:Ger(x)C family spore germination protein [Paenibacillus sp. CGMCC 1.16610]|uniref:Ger(X)C family spore germination protein n=1 Tax=Paenibacillus anseongense TaxID=2682845 RepID=A0ABW9U972_9BACL|nr:MULTISPECIES: Ger(x)C family spore germination protein [Paenibacillus]MBA2937629.1 Ger(x)C family spore germination protein [Paenibacillus sp. CGMCC 1.16610]MVQ36687.1 Ger(x)C family spore germination protein [Paenibacillus anseongense]